MDSERVRYASGERLHDARRVEDDGDGHGKHDERHEPSDLASEQEEDRHDADDAEEQRAEQALQVGNETLRAQGQRNRCGSEMSMHYTSPPGSNDHSASVTTAQGTPGTSCGRADAGSGSLGGSSGPAAHGGPGGRARPGGGSARLEAAATGADDTGTDASAPGSTPEARWWEADRTELQASRS